LLSYVMDVEEPTVLEAMSRNVFHRKASEPAPVDGVLSSGMPEGSLRGGRAASDGGLSTRVEASSPQGHSWAKTSTNFGRDAPTGVSRE